MSLTIQVFPPIGYRNSTYSFYFNAKGSGVAQLFQLEKGDVPELFKEIIIADFEAPLLIENLPAGLYCMRCNQPDKLPVEFEVLDSVCLGDSELKKTYVFDDFPLAFLVKKDRCLIYDQVTGRTVTLFGISPGNMIKVSASYVLWLTQVEAKVNLALFSAKQLTRVWELMDVQLICQTSTGCWISRAPNEIQLIDFSNDQAEPAILFQNAFEELLDVPGYGHLYLIIEHAQLLMLDKANGQLIGQLDLSGIDNYAIDGEWGLVFVQDESGISVHRLRDRQVHQLDGPALLDDCNHTWLKAHFEKANRPDKARMAERLEDHVVELVSALEPGTRFVFEREAQGLAAFDYVKNSYTYFQSGTEGLVLHAQYTIKCTRYTGMRSRFNDARNNILYQKHPEMATEHINSFSNGLNATAYKTKELTNGYLLKIATEEKTLLNLSINDQLIVLDAAVFEEFVWQDYELYNCQNKKFLFAKNTVKVVVYLIENNEPLLVLNFLGTVYRNLANEIGILVLTDAEGCLFRFDLAAYMLQKIVIKQSQPDGRVQKFDLKQSDIVSRDRLATRHGLLINPKNGFVRSGVAGDVIAASDDLHLLLADRKAEGIFAFSAGSSERDYRFVMMTGNPFFYEKAALDPKGRYAIVKSKQVAEYQLYDLETLRVTNFISGNFVQFSNDGDLIIEDDLTRSPKILDPVTLQNITPGNFHFYRFRSPDEQLYSQLSRRYGYYHVIDRREIDIEEFEAYEKRFKAPERREDWEAWNRRLRIYLDEVKARYPFLTENLQTIDDIVLPVTFIDIGITGSDIKLALPLTRMRFYNYLAFSPDNRYVAVVGRAETNGKVHFFRLQFDKDKQTLSFDAVRIYDEPSHATWTCGFSYADNYFATYDSNPKTHMLPVSDELFQGSHPYRRLTTRQLVVDHYSYKCFNPVKHEVAFSKEGYSAVSTGGKGHIESKVISVYDYKNQLHSKTYAEHGEHIDLVAYSEDGTQLLSHSRDGVIIIRKIQI